MIGLSFYFIYFSIFYANVTAVPVLLDLVKLSDKNYINTNNRITVEDDTDYKKMLSALSKCLTTDKLSKINCLEKLKRNIKKPHLFQENINKERLNKKIKPQEFSDDYIDFLDDKTNNVNVYVLELNDNPDFRRHDSDFIKYKILRGGSDFDDSSSDSDDLTRKEVLKSYSNKKSSESKESSFEEMEIPKPAKKRKRRVKKYPSPPPPKFYYMQGPSRLIGERRRMPHFLPKRYHWDVEDFKDLSNYWINGPQGKYSGLYKTPY